MVESVFIAGSSSIECETCLPHCIFSLKYIQFVNSGKKQNQRKNLFPHVSGNSLTNEKCVFLSRLPQLL